MELPQLPAREPNSSGQLREVAPNRRQRRAEMKAAKTSATHPDNMAVDRFAETMKEKLAKKRAEGRGGWEDKDQCSAEFLSSLLREHVDKGDPVDVANLAMMLHQRGDRIAAPAIAAEPTVRWVEWKGGDFLPVPQDLPVTILMRDGSTEGPTPAREFAGDDSCWRHRGSPGDIVAYTSDLLFAAPASAEPVEKHYTSQAESAWDEGDLRASALLTNSEKIDQATRCGCKGVDDYCPCQNVADRETVTRRNSSLTIDT